MQSFTHGMADSGHSDTTEDAMRFTRPTPRSNAHVHINIANTSLNHAFIVCELM